MKPSNLTIFFFLIFLYISCSFFREETAITDEPLQVENLESDIRWVDILDGTEMFENPSEDSRVLASLHFRSKLKVSPTTKTSEGWEFVEYKSKKGWINMEVAGGACTCMLGAKPRRLP
jgi:hypothetical protein